LIISSLVDGAQAAPTISFSHTGAALTIQQLAAGETYTGVASNYTDPVTGLPQSIQYANASIDNAHLVAESLLQYANPTHNSSNLIGINSSLINNSSIVDTGGTNVIDLGSDSAFTTVADFPVQPVMGIGLSQTQQPAEHFVSFQNQNAVDLSGKTGDTDYLINYNGSDTIKSDLNVKVVINGHGYVTGSGSNAADVGGYTATLVQNTDSPDIHAYNDSPNQHLLTFDEASLNTWLGGAPTFTATGDYLDLNKVDFFTANGVSINSMNNYEASAAVTKTYASGGPGFVEVLIQDPNNSSTDTVQIWETTNTAAPVASSGPTSDNSHLLVTLVGIPHGVGVDIHLALAA
jgi:hypothetical protein